MAYAHSQDIAHLDLKPGNILCEADGRTVRLADFSIAADTLSRDTTMLPEAARGAGSADYQAPEQRQGSHNRLGLRADLWSFGVLALELLLQLPASHIQAHAETNRSWLEDRMKALMLPLREKLLACLSVESKQRPTASQMYETLCAVLLQM